MTFSGARTSLSGKSAINDLKMQSMTDKNRLVELMVNFYSKTHKAKCFISRLK